MVGAATTTEIAVEIVNPGPRTSITTTDGTRTARKKNVEVLLQCVKNSSARAEPMNVSKRGLLEGTAGPRERKANNKQLQDNKENDVEHVGGKRHAEAPNGNKQSCAGPNDRS